MMMNLLVQTVNVRFFFFCSLLQMKLEKMI